ncbi:hypothetical protein CDAR_296441 [Caerostris darwini]|uniref:Uncharacterized protein n=1 Tax=Caerostris darwini TaxID=1538125 RepID=A0AAV4PJF4_9ARAC|nr:hypothetical protein CDAR_296441 [Caerostris darwini]
MQKYSLSILLSKKQLADASIQEALGGPCSCINYVRFNQLRGSGVCDSRRLQGIVCPKKGRSEGKWDRLLATWTLLLAFRKCHLFALEPNEYSRSEVFLFSLETTINRLAVCGELKV